MSINAYPVEMLPTTIYGLEYEPSFVNRSLNDKDHLECSGCPKGLDEHFSPFDQQVLLETIREVAPDTILEIGVHRPRSPGQVSSTQILIKNKDPEAVYIGVDLLPKHIDGWGKNVHFIQANSSDRYLVASKMVELGRESLDLIMIDGWHSVDQVLKDWQYVEWLSDHGAVVLHDTDRHPGPVVLLNAIDRNLFVVEQYVPDTPDWGITVVKRRSTDAKCEQ